MTVLCGLSQSCFRALVLTVLLNTFCPLDIGATEPPVERPAKAKVQTAMPVLEAYGLPVEKLEFLLNTGQTAQIRAVLGRTPIHKGDEEVRRLWLAVCLSVERSYEESSAEFSKVKHLDRASGPVLCAAAQSYAQTQDFARAIELSSLAIGRGYVNPGYELRATCYNLEKRYIEAADDYQKAAKFRPRLASDFYCRAANALLSANKPLSALAVCDKAPPMARGPGKAALLLTKGVCYEKLNRWSDGVTTLTEAIATARAGLSNRENASTLGLINSLVERAKCYDKLGKKAEAAEDRRWQEQLSGGIENDLIGKDR
jgi:tetratricopeptide (TPR) repeat protein